MCLNEDDREEDVMRNSAVTPSLLSLPSVACCDGGHDILLLRSLSSSASCCWMLSHSLCVRGALWGLPSSVCLRRELTCGLSRHCCSLSCSRCVALR